MYRQNAEISALSSGDLDKYEYLTEKDLQYKPNPLQKAKFEYSPLGQVFNKGLKTNEKSEGFLKRLKNIGDKTDNQLLAIEDQGNKLKKIGFYNPQSERSRKAAQEINKLIDEIKKVKNAPRDINKRYQPKFNFTCSHKDIDYFDKYTDLRKFEREIQNGLITIDEARQLRRNMKKEINDLKGYAAKSDKTKNDKEKVLKNFKIHYEGIKKVIKGFEDGDFLIKDFSRQSEQPSGSKDEQPSGSKDDQKSEESEESEKDGESEKDEE